MPRPTAMATPMVRDPMVATVKAAVRPFDVQKGVSSSLYMNRPSQKFMAKANTSISIPAGCNMVFMAAPCIASDSTYASIIFGVQTAAGTPMSGNWSNSVVGDQVITGGTITRLSTNTPYPAATLALGYEWACCGSGLRFTYEGTEFNRSGTFKYTYDPEYSFNAGNSTWGAKGPANNIAFTDASANNIRQSINKNNVVEINTFIAPADYAIGDGGSCWVAGLSGAAIGGTTATTQFSTAPKLIGYFLNSSSNTVSFHVEMIEHWNVSSPTIQSLQTDSVAHPVLADQVGTFLMSTRQNHALQPNDHHVDVMKSTQKALGSPLGHELLNTALRAALV